MRFFMAAYTRLVVNNKGVEFRFPFLFVLLGEIHAQFRENHRIDASADGEPY